MKQPRLSLLKVLCVLVCFGYYSPLPAAELTDLYQARVPAQAKDWQSQAMQAVLLKLTGKVPTELQAELKQAASYVVQYQQTQQAGQTELLVTVDRQKINQLLQRHQIAIWGPRRADMLIWLTERTAQTPQFVLDGNHPIRAALAQSAARYGLALQFPLFDEIDTTQLTPEITWGGDWVLIQQASQRYRTPEVLNLMFDQFTDASGQVQFRLSWQQWVDGAMQQRELSGVDAVTLTESFASELAQQQYQRYAVKLTNGPGTTLTLTISALEQWTSLVKVQQLFNSMLTVQSSHLLQFGNGQAQLRLQLTASEDEFYRNLALVQEFIPEPSPTADAAALPVADSADPAGGDSAAAGQDSQTDQSETEHRISDSALHQSAVTDASTADTEALLEQALADTSAGTADGTAPQTELTTPAIPVSPVLVKASHYRYQPR